MEDIDLNLEDFVARVNSDLVGKYVNIASRAAGFISHHFDGALHQAADIEKLAQALVDTRDAGEQIRHAYDAREYGKAIRIAMQAADQINKYFDAVKPWELAKKASVENKEELHKACSACLRAFQYLTLWLKPVLPDLASKAEAFLDCGSLQWTGKLPALKRIKPYQHLMTRIDPKQITALVEANKENLQVTTTTPPSPLPLSLRERGKVRAQVRT